MIEEEKQGLTIFPLKPDKSPATGGDWRKYSGDVNSSIYGVAVPAGVIVIDVDSYKEGVDKNEMTQLIAFEIYWDEALLQQTRSGGEHYAFSVPVDSNLINGTDVLGLNGIDTRSAGKGFIATGEGYTDCTMCGLIRTLANPELLPPLPDELLSLLTSGAARDVDGFDDFAGMVAAQPLDIGREDVERYIDMLTVEDSTEGGTWLKVMFALYHQSEGSAWGWELFDKFSQKSTLNYDEHANRNRWESCARSKKANPITFASVIELVKSRGVIVGRDQNDFEELLIDIKSCADQFELEKATARSTIIPLSAAQMPVLHDVLAKKYSEIMGVKYGITAIKKIIKEIKGVARHATVKGGAGFVEDYVFSTARCEFIHRTNKTAICTKSMDLSHKSDTPLTLEGEPQTATGYLSDKVPMVFDLMYAPSLGDIFTYKDVDYFNSYRPTTLEPVPVGTTDIVDRVLGHIKHLLSDEKEQTLLIDYLAYQVQHTGRKLNWALILQGVQGDGKSFLAEMMQHIMGFSNCRKIDGVELDEKFTGWAEGSSLIIIEELKVDNYKKYETLNKLKPYITNPTVSVRRMRTDTYEAINTANYLGLTNYKDALPIDDSDRRYAVLFSQWQDSVRLRAWESKNAGYYQSLYDDMRRNCGEVLSWFLAYKITPSFYKLNRAPTTSAKLEMIDLAKNDECLIVEDAINEFECGDINSEVVNVTKLQICIKNDFDGNWSEFPNSGKLKYHLNSLGYHRLGRYKNKDRKNQTIYGTDSTKKAEDYIDGDIVPF